MSLVEIRGLERGFTTPEGTLHALRRIDLDARAGEFLCVTGPSGAGKSTLLNVLGGLDPDYEGSFRFDGVEVSSLAPAARAELFRRETAFIFQRYHLLDDLDVAANLALPLEYREVPAAERAQRVDAALERFGLTAKRRFRPDQLSGGEQQMLAVLRAAISQPRLILADEPTGALHSEQGEAVLDLLAELNADGICVIMVTHSETAAARAGRRHGLRDGWLESRPEPA